MNSLERPWKSKRLVPESHGLKLKLQISKTKVPKTISWKIKSRKENITNSPNFLKNKIPIAKSWKQNPKSRRSKITNKLKSWKPKTRKQSIETKILKAKVLKSKNYEWTKILKARSRKRKTKSQIPWKLKSRKKQNPESKILKAKIQKSINLKWGKFLKSIIWNQLKLRNRKSQKLKFRRAKFWINPKSEMDQNPESKISKPKIQKSKFLKSKIPNGPKSRKFQHLESQNHEKSKFHYIQEYIFKIPRVIFFPLAQFIHHRILKVVPVNSCLET